MMSESEKYLLYGMLAAFGLLVYLVLLGVMRQHPKQKHFLYRVFPELMKAILVMGLLVLLGKWLQIL